MPKPVLILSTADWNHPFWTNKQHTAVLFAKQGRPVLYVESVGLRAMTLKARDLSRVWGRLKRLATSRVRKVRENIWVLSPFVIPFHGSKAIRELNTRLLRAQIRAGLKRLGGEKVLVWTYNPLSLELARQFPRTKLVYHCVDDLTAAPGLPSDAVREQEKALCEAADVVFTTSRKLFEKMSANAPGKVHYHSNVADWELFSKARGPLAEPADLANIPHPRIGFVGAISEYKLDFRLIHEVAKRRPEWNWVLIGQVGEGQPQTSIDLLKLPNIHLLGPREYRDLPSYLRSMDVASIPCPRNEYTVSMFPMKFFEYLAAGVKVIASRLPALEEFQSAYWPADTAEEFVSGVESALRGAPEKERLMLELARKHTWENRFNEMMKVVQA